MSGRYWKVKIPSGQWMAGIRRFGTKRDAQKFVDDYELAHCNKPTYGSKPSTPTIENDDPRKARDHAMRSLGMVKVRGALGGTYWE